MKPRAIIYCSKHGSTKQIADILQRKYGLPVININHISGYSFQSVPVIFCGCIKNMKIQGLNRANELFTCVEVIAVGSREENETLRLKLKYANNIDKSIFTYIQSSNELKPTFSEKIWISLFQPSLLKRHERKELNIKHEYTV